LASTRGKRGRISIRPACAVDGRALLASEILAKDPVCQTGGNSIRITIAFARALNCGPLISRQICAAKGMVGYAGRKFICIAVGVSRALDGCALVRR
jgi:hypothetical protein